MVKRILFFCSIILCMYADSMAQFRLGPTGSMGINRQIYKSNSYRYEGLFKNRLGYQVGVITDLILTPSLSLQSELLYARRGGYYKLEKANITEEYTTDLGYVTLPVCLTYKLDLKSAYVIFGAGPYLGKLLHSNHTYKSNDINIENGALRVGSDYNTDQIKPWDAGLKLKAGFELKKGFYMVAYYDISTADINPNFTVTRNKTLGIQFAYIFSLTEEDRYSRFEKFYEF